MSTVRAIGSASKWSAEKKEWADRALGLLDGHLLFFQQPADVSDPLLRVGAVGLRMAELTEEDGGKFTPPPGPPHVLRIKSAKYYTALAFSTAQDCKQCLKVLTEQIKKANKGATATTLPPLRSRSKSPSKAGSTVSGVGSSSSSSIGKSGTAPHPVGKTASEKVIATSLPPTSSKTPLRRAHSSSSTSSRSSTSAKASTSTSVAKPAPSKPSNVLPPAVAKLKRVGLSKPKRIGLWDDGDESSSSAPRGPTRKQGAWRTIHVFVSSTFRDMHAERDVLTRIVFPWVNDHLTRRLVRLVPVDLRWGLTEEDTSSDGKGALEICLDEIDHARGWFVLLGGERYGWVPPKYQHSDLPQYDWLEKIDPGQSITALEIYHGFLSPSFAGKTHALAYFRDPAFINDLPAHLKPVFSETDKAATKKLHLLQQKIQGNPDIIATLNYPATLTKDASVFADKNNSNVLVGLEAFVEAVQYDLLQAAMVEFPEEVTQMDPIDIERFSHSTSVARSVVSFRGRKQLCDSLLNYAKSNKYDSQICVLHGPIGSGKSALLAELVEALWNGDKNLLVVPLFTGSSIQSSTFSGSLVSILFALLAEIPGRVRDIAAWSVKPTAVLYQEILNSAAAVAKARGGNVVIVWDSVSSLKCDNEADFVSLIF